MTRGMTTFAAGVLMLVGFSVSAAEAQTASPVPAVAAGPPTLVLVPYQETADTTDPHAVQITTDLAGDLAKAGISVAAVPPMDHLEAVASAAKLCADQHVNGLLIPEGRYEQTVKIVPIGLLTQVTHYPTHVEFRIDEIACDGTIRWTTTATGDQNPGGLGTGVANLNSYIDTAFRTAEQNAVHALATAPPGPATGAFAAVPPATGAPVVPTTYLLLSLGQPTIADPHIADADHSLMLRLQERKIALKIGTPIDHLAVVTQAAKLCEASGTQAILVPSVRIEQSSFSGKSHASMRVDLLNCSGAVIAHGSAEADVRGGGHNFGAGVTQVAEQAMPGALDQLFPATAAASTAAK